MRNLSELDGVKKAIYTIEHDRDPEKTFLDFFRYKQLKARACAKLNAPARILYVGSSITNVKKRIAEHLGHGGSAT